MEDFGASQISYYVTTRFNSLCEKWALLKNKIDVVVFYDNLHRNCMIPQFATMQMIEAWDQKGVTVATSLNTAYKLLSFPGPIGKIYYVWDLVWMRMNPRIYSISRDVFTSPNLTLVARSLHHKRAIENAFNMEVPYVIPDCDIVQFIEVSEQWWKIQESGGTKPTLKKNAV